MSKPLWRILLLITGALALWRGTTAGIALWDYLRLGPQVPLQRVEFQVIPKGSKYRIGACYVYLYQNKEFAGKMLFSRVYLNERSAELGIEELSARTKAVWIDADAPKVSSLQKKFPLRSVFYAACLLGVFLYFCYLKIHLELLSKSM